VNSNNKCDGKENINDTEGSSDTETFYLNATFVKIARQWPFYSWVPPEAISRSPMGQSSKFRASLLDVVVVAVWELAENYYG
jgi:hypothetical protein